ncbi:MAG: acyl-ACP--UDP-N-acetylglucosamine O-acyltransferase [Gammaproteobacteria bacterium]
MIHPTAVVHPDARIGDGVTIGPYSDIGPGVDIGAGTSVASHVVIKGPCRVGSDNRIFQFCSIGDEPQDKKFRGEKESALVIGDGNVIREYCSINRGTSGGGGTTRIGNNNWIMGYVHVAHDCVVGNHAVFANNATLAGHVRVDDYAILGGFTGIHQYCRVGKHSFSAIASVIVKDVPPYILVSGNTARPTGLNREGLKRHGFGNGDIEILRRAYRIVYRDGLLLKDALTELASLIPQCAAVADFRSFIESSERGVVR